MINEYVEFWILSDLKRAKNNIKELNESEFYLDTDDKIAIQKELKEIGELM